MTPLERHCGWLLRAYPAWYRRQRAGEMLGTLLEASPPGARWPSFRDARALVTGGLGVRGWTWLLSMLWVVIGAGGAIYAAVAFSHPGYGEGLLIPPNIQWPGEPQAIIDVGVVAEVAWVLLSIPLLAAGLVRLRGWRPASGIVVLGNVCVRLPMIAGHPISLGIGSPRRWSPTWSRCRRTSHHRG